MIGWLLDTNVVSELSRPRPDERVIGWLRDLPTDRTFVSVLTLAELDQGIEALAPDDQRRPGLQRFRSRVEARFAGRTLMMDDETVRLWGAISGRYTRSLGGKAPIIDAMLVASAQRRRLYIATRNVRDMRLLGGTPFNPWIDNPADFPLQG